MAVFQCIVLVRELNAKCFGKSVPEIVARPCLQCLAVVHQRFDRIGSLRPREFFFVSLLPLYHGNRKYVPHEIRIDIEHLNRSLLRLLCRRMGRVSLLPQKFAAPQERTRRLLPAHHGAPLVIYLRQIPVGLHFILIKIAEKRLRGRAHAQSLLQRLESAVCHPRNLRRKALNVILLLFQKAFRYEHRHVHILHARLLERRVELLLDLLPDRIARGLDDHTALHTRVVAQLRLLHHVCVPLREILLHRGDRLH